MRQYVAKRLVETPVAIVASATIRRGKSMNRVLVRHVEKPAAEITARPFVKWAGGKTKLLPELLARIPKGFNRYYEPFCGGGALYYALSQRDGWTGSRATLGDTNADLMNVYQVVQRDVTALVKELARLQKNHRRHGEVYYYKVRDSWNDPALSSDTWNTADIHRVVRAAQFIFLNKTCFNGLYRVNSDGEFNVSHGDYKKPVICDAPNLFATSLALAGMKLCTGVYQKLMPLPRENDLVYFDPPYDPVSTTANFVGYDAGGFDREAQRELAEHAKSLRSAGVHVMLSNSDTKFIRSLYPRDFFKLDRVLVPRAINSDATKRGGVPELIITGRPL